MYLYTFIRQVPNKIVLSNLGQDGLFTFKIPVQSSSGYFRITRKIPVTKRIRYGEEDAELTKMFYWSIGDDIMISITKIAGTKDIANVESDIPYVYHTVFSGNGARKYQQSLNADSIYSSHWNDKHISLPGEYGQMLAMAGRDTAIQYLNTHSTGIKYAEIEVLKADLLFSGAEANFHDMTRNFKDTLAKNKKLDIGNYLRLFQAFQKKYINQISAAGLANSYEFPKYAIREAEEEYMISHRINDQQKALTEISLANILPIISLKYTGEVRDNILANLFFYYLKTEDAEKDSAAVLALMSNSANKQKLAHLLSSHAEGMPAYNFNLPDTSGVNHSLKSLRGKVVYQDFNYVGCGPCAGLYENVLKKAEEHYKENKNVVFVSISCDPSLERFKMGVRSGKYNSALSLNLYTGGKGFTHEMIRYYSIKGYPEVLLIDKYGRIARFDTADIRNENGIIKQIDRLLKE